MKRNNRLLKVAIAGLAIVGIGVTSSIKRRVEARKRAAYLWSIFDQLTTRTLKLKLSGVHLESDLLVSTRAVGTGIVSITADDETSVDLSNLVGERPYVEFESSTGTIRHSLPPSEMPDTFTAAWTGGSAQGTIFSSFSEGDPIEAMSATLSLLELEFPSLASTGHEGIYVLLRTKALSQYLFQSAPRVSTANAFPELDGIKNCANFRIGGFDYAVCSRTENSFISIHGPGIAQHYELHLKAILNALSFQNGYRIDYRAICIVKPDGSRLVKIYRPTIPPQRRPVLIPPLQVYVHGQSGISFVQCVTNFFLVNQQSCLFDALKAFWSTDSSYAMAREAVLGSALEALAREVYQLISPNSPQETRLVAEEADYERIQRILKACMKNHPTFGNGVSAQRVRSMIGSAKFSGGNKMLAEACIYFGITMSKQEKQAVSDTRNPAAHGLSISAEMDHDRLRNFKSTVTVLHRLALARVGWTGRINPSSGILARPL